MERPFNRFTQPARDYIAKVERDVRSRPPRAVAARIRELVREHDQWRHRQSISLNAAENITSAWSRQLLNSDLATRVTEGFPGAKDFPAHRQNRFIDEIEATIISLATGLFKAKYVEWRPVSTSMANATVFLALTRPGQTILAQPESSGGNYSYNPMGPPLAAHLNVAPLPCLEETFEIDVEAAVKAIKTTRPQMIAFGGSNVLFPYPVRELSEAAASVGATVLYDAAHIALLIAAGEFQSPLEEGAHLITASSHKIMCGPVGGWIFMNDEALANKIFLYSFPTLIQTRDQNKYAATAHALAEMTEFGTAYARQMVRNAHALGDALQEEGFGVVATQRRYTRTHQIFVLIRPQDEAEFEGRCQQANLLATRAQRMGSSGRVAARLTTQEMTRWGMTEEHMPVIARWLRRVVLDREDPQRIAAEIEHFLGGFPTLQYSYDEETRP